MDAVNVAHMKNAKKRNNFLSKGRIEKGRTLSEQNKRKKKIILF
jgi:hypothetical protein